MQESAVRDARIRQSCVRDVRPVRESMKPFGGERILRMTGLYLLTMLLGCVGPKFMSSGTGSQQLWRSGTRYEAISLRPIREGGEAADPSLNYVNRLLQVLAQKLEDESLFAHVTTVSSGEDVQTPLLLEVMVINVGEAGWGARAVWGKESKAAVAGRLIDVDTDRVLLTFGKSRSGSGGLLGMGGWLSAGEETMAMKHLEWVADDVVAIVRPYGQAKR